MGACATTAQSHSSNATNPTRIAQARDFRLACSRVRAWCERRKAELGVRPANFSATDFAFFCQNKS